MRNKGKLWSRNDQKGFGFIDTGDGSIEVFLTSINGRTEPSCQLVGYSLLRKSGEPRMELYTECIERHRNGMVLPDSKHKDHQLLCRVVLAE